MSGAGQSESRTSRSKIELFWFAKDASSEGRNAAKSPPLGSPVLACKQLDGAATRFLLPTPTNFFSLSCGRAHDVFVNESVDANA